MPENTPTERRDQINRKSFYAWLTIALFGGLLIMPSAAQVFGIGIASKENRELAPFPVLTKPKDLKNLPRLLDSYVNDRFGLRSQLVHFNSLLRYWIGRSSTPTVVFGKDGWLFLTVDRILEQHTGEDIFKPNELENWVRQMELNRDWLESRGIAFYIVAAPEKTTIYPEKLPDYPPIPGTVTRMDQLVTRLQNSTLEFIDPRASLLEAKAKGFKVYDEGDSHWSQRGAFIVYSLLIDRIHKRFPNVVAKTIDEYSVKPGPGPADLAHLLALDDDLHYQTEQFTPLGRKHQIGPAAISDRPGWPWRIFEIPTDLKDRPRLLVTGDSFSFVLAPFLYETFRDPVYTHHLLGNVNIALVKEIQPDIVIFQFAERYLQEHFLQSPLGVPIGAR
jgi:alginate O-acetyltransferase complex protein AlgJ